MSSWRSIWLGKVWHLFFLLALAGFLVGTYGISHRALNTKYKASVTNLVEGAFKLYRLQPSADGSSVVLAQAGQPLKPDFQDLAKAPFGLEKLDAYRGILNHYLGIASQITAYYQRRKENLLQAFRAVGNPVYHRLQLTSLNCNTPSLSSEIAGDQFERLKGKNFEEFALSAAALLLSGYIYDSTASGTLALGDSGNATVDSAVNGGKQMADPFRGSRLEAIPDECRSAITAFFDSWGVDLVPSIETSCKHKFATKTNNTTLDEILFALSCQLQTDLSHVAEGETGSFWLMGRYRWWELIFWVWFGVVTMSLVKHVPILVGAKTKTVWEPRETLAVFGKLFYAPVLALVIIFMLGFLGFGQNEAAEFGRSSLVNLGIAFILGLFPNTSWRIIRDLCTRLFRDDIREGEKKTRVPEVVTVRSRVTKMGATTVYTIDDLKKNVIAHFTAPLNQTQK